MQTLKVNHKQFDSLIIKTIKYNLILDQRGTSSPELNLICEELSELFENKLDISCLKWIAHKWLPKRG